MIKSAEDQLADFISIKTPGILFDVVESLVTFVDQGLLREVGGTVSLKEIVRGDPYPDDIINIRFETIPGGTLYALSCETYHGFGGVFKRL